MDNDRIEPARIAREAIFALQRNDQLALELAYFALSDQDIAQCLAIPLPTLKTRICVAMRRFRHVLITLRR
jgi:DNA-directed RNA polymerase specialized sigma24 family protein